MRFEILEVKCFFIVRDMIFFEVINFIKEFCLGICIFLLLVLDFKKKKKKIM